jgi:hypothetical protein
MGAVSLLNAPRTSGCFLTFPAFFNAKEIIRDVIAYLLHLK